MVFHTSPGEFCPLLRRGISPSEILFIIGNGGVVPPHFGENSPPVFPKKAPVGHKVLPAERPFFAQFMSVTVPF